MTYLEYKSTYGICETLNKLSLSVDTNYLPKLQNARMLRIINSDEVDINPI